MRANQQKWRVLSRLDEIAFRIDQEGTRSKPPGMLFDPAL
jgi:hypothetical protein